MFLDVLEGYFTFESLLELFASAQHIEKRDAFVNCLGDEAAEGSYLFDNTLDVLMFLGRGHVYECLNLFGVGLYSLRANNEIEELPGQDSKSTFLWGLTSSHAFKSRRKLPQGHLNGLQKFWILLACPLYKLPCFSLAGH